MVYKLDIKRDTATKTITTCLTSLFFADCILVILTVWHTNDFSILAKLVVGSETQVCAWVTISNVCPAQTSSTCKHTILMVTFIFSFQINESSASWYLANGSSGEIRKMPKVTVSGLELDIDGNTFKGGKAKLKCTATLFNIYNKTTEVVLEEERPRPRPSSVLGTREPSSGKPNITVPT